MRARVRALGRLGEGKGWGGVACRRMMDTGDGGYTRLKFFFVRKVSQRQQVSGLRFWLIPIEME